MVVIYCSCTALANVATAATSRKKDLLKGTHLKKTLKVDQTVLRYTVDNEKGLIGRTT